MSNPIWIHALNAASFRIGAPFRWQEVKVARPTHFPEYSAPLYRNGTVVEVDTLALRVRVAPSVSPVSSGEAKE